MLTYEETLDFLYHLGIERMDLKLERIVDALQRCGSPHRFFPSLHVAGTNGKGSTASFLHAMLSAAGYRVGLFTSPHLVDFCERIRLGERHPVVQIPPEWPRALLVFARIMMVPAVAAARVIAWLEEIFFPHRPDASEVRRQATPRLQMDSRPPRKR